MAASQKSRTPIKDPSRALDAQVLKESGNEISLNLKIEISLGERNGEEFKSPTSMVVIDGQILYQMTAAEYAKFDLYDEVIVGSYSNSNKYNNVHGCIVAKDDVNYRFKLDVKKSLFHSVAQDLYLAKEIFIRASNVGSYKNDEWGIGRYFEPTASLSEVENNMGELFEYGWNQGDFSFSIENYDGKFDKYLPGGDEETSFLGREVRVFLSGGEEAHKNKLIFHGITHFNDSVGQEDEVLNFTAAHISYVYDNPIATQRFHPLTFDENMRGELIPHLYGNYTTNGKFIGGVQRPIVPATLVSWGTDLKFSYILLNKNNSTYPSSNFKITARTGGSLYNDHTITLNYILNRAAPTTTPASSWSLTLNTFTSKYNLSISLYPGVATDGTNFSSTLWIKKVIESCPTFTALFACEGENNTGLPDFNIPTQNYSNPYNVTFRTSTHTFQGGSENLIGFYKISANPLISNPNEKVWYVKGTYDDPTQWESAANTIAGTALTVVFHHDISTVVVKDIPPATDMTKYKCYVYCEGNVTKYTGETYRNDPNLWVNVPYNNLKGGTTSQCVNQSYTYNGGEFKLVSSPKFSSGFAARIIPLHSELVPEVPQSCHWEWLGTVRKCSGGNPAYWRNHQSLSIFSWNYQPIVRDNEDFVFEMEFKDLTFTHNYYQVNYQESQNPTLLSLNTRYKNHVRLYINSSRQLVINSNGKETVTNNFNVQKDTTYKVKVAKIANQYFISLKNLETGGPWVNGTYVSQPLFTNIDNNKIVTLIVGTDDVEQFHLNANHANLEVGCIRFAINTNTFLDDDFVPMITNDMGAPTYVLSLAKAILLSSGVPEWKFDDSWTNLKASRVNNPYDARIYIDDDKKTLETVVALLGQAGIVMTMKENNGEMKFSVIPDSTDFYQTGSKNKITDNDIELGSLKVERELNQYFNTANATYNRSPMDNDDFIGITSNYFEPLAYKRDGFLDIWLRKKDDDKVITSLPLPNLYSASDVEKRLREVIANSTPNTEMVTLTLSWRHLFLQIGDFVQLSYGRYKNIPMQVRSVKIDATGTKVEVKLRSLENLPFIDYVTGEQYTPKNYNGIGGNLGKANIIEKTEIG